MIAVGSGEKWADSDSPGGEWGGMVRIGTARAGVPQVPLQGRAGWEGAKRECVMGLPRVTWRSLICGTVRFAWRDCAELGQACAGRRVCKRSRFS